MSPVCSMPPLEQLAEVVDQTADAIMMIDSTGFITYVNHAYELIFEVDGAAVVGRLASDVATGQLCTSDLDELTRGALEGKPFVANVESTRSSGCSLFLEVTTTPLRDPDGNVLGYLVVSRDVSALRTAQTELALQEKIDRALAESVGRIDVQATLEQAAQAVCESLTCLPFIDAAMVCSYIGSDIRISGFSASEQYSVPVGSRLPEACAVLIRERTGAGPWAERVSLGDEAVSLLAPGLRAIACGPIVHGEHIDGVVMIGTSSESLSDILVAKMPGLLSFSTASTSLLAERLHGWRWRAELRKSVETLLADRTFRPVFQPIVELASGRTVGYEALTRFEWDLRPDLSFAQAWSAGLGADLELATLDAAIMAARTLPAGRWLDLNLSPRMFERPDELRLLLRQVDRPLVLEITEHDIIDDYAAVREAVHGLGPNVRLAVDDAGAGIANFGHIVELRPDLVKLDISLVRGVNANIGRQAMVVGMSHFSRTAGCRLVAEGVETVSEASALTELGVEFGQGYLFGRPEPADVWSEAIDRGHLAATSIAAGVAGVRV